MVYWLHVGCGFWLLWCWCRGWAVLCWFVVGLGCSLGLWYNLCSQPERDVGSFWSLPSIPSAGGGWSANADLFVLLCLLLSILVHQCTYFYILGNLGNLMPGIVHCCCRVSENVHIWRPMYRFAHWCQNRAINYNPRPAMYIIDQWWWYESHMNVIWADCWIWVPGRDWRNVGLQSCSDLSIRVHI